MKNLYIHIGFPKTATTTLQENVLHTLNLTDNNINFFQNKHIKKSYDFLHFLFRDIDKVQRDLYYSTEGYNDYFDLINGKNYISEEVLTVPRAYRNRNLYDSFTIINKIKRYVEKINQKNIKIILSIRSHPKMIYSLSVQAFSILKSKYKFNNLNELLLRDGTFDKERFEEFDYYEIIKKLIEIVGKKNVCINLFEDLKYDKENYFKFMSEAFDIELETFKTLYENKHENMKDKNQDGYFADFKTQRKIIKFIIKISNLPVIKELKRAIKKTKLNTYKLRLLDKTEKHKKIPVPYLSQDVNQQIFEAFRDSNKKLCELMELDEEKMKKYGYFD